MEQRGGADEVAARVEGDAARGLGICELVDGGEVAIDQHGIRQRPQMLGGLELGRIRREKPQVDVLGMRGHAQLDARMPARAIQHEDDLFGGAGADLTGEGRQLDFEEGDADRRWQMGQMQDRAPGGGGMDEADQGAPGVAVLHRGRGPLPIETPDLVQERLQADAVLIDGPECDLRAREGSRDGLDERPDVFLQAACCSGSACTWRGRGVRRLPSKRTREAQPR